MSLAVEYVRGSTEWGTLAHRVRDGVIFGAAASAACGRFALLWVPPDPGATDCAQCFPTPTRERER